MDELEETIQHNTYLTELFSMLPKDIFYKNKMFGNSQLKFLIEQENIKNITKPNSMFLSDSHPSELGNELWSNELYNTEQIQDFLK